MEAGLPDTDSEDARSGRFFHRYWTNPNYDRAFLTPEDRDLLEVSDRLLLDVLNRLAFETVHDVRVEHTIATRDGKLSGTPDQVYFWFPRKTALVNDLKSGFAAVERAELNLQLRGYAVLVGDTEPVERVYVSILQPRLWSHRDRVTLARYEAEDLSRARDEVYGIIAATEAPDAPLRAGEEQCRYCRAKLLCPAFRAAIAAVPDRFRPDPKLSKRAREDYIERRLKECTDEQLEAVLAACTMADHVSAAARDEARTRIAAGAFTKFILGKEWNVRTVKNVRRAIAMLALAGVASREDILDICDIPLDQLEKNYRARHGGTWDAARDKINKVLKSVIELEPRKPKILRK